MGKKSAKGKEKKLQRKAEQAQLSGSLAIVKEANLVSDPLENFAVFKKFNRNGLDVSISCKQITSMDQEEKDSIFKLVKDNMQDLYTKSNWGWDEKKKLEEMMEEDARYLIVRDENAHIVAMSHFRFDVDADMAVLYCYEVQLLEQVRGKGLGKFLMQILELMANKAGLTKCILTVFKENEKANKFFANLKYIVDETSPQYDDPNNPQDYDYEILSKTFKPKVVQAEE